MCRPCRVGVAGPVDWRVLQSVISLVCTRVWQPFHVFDTAVCRLRRWRAAVGVSHVRRVCVFGLLRTTPWPGCAPQLCAVSSGASWAVLTRKCWWLTFGLYVWVNGAWCRPGVARWRVRCTALLCWLGTAPSCGPISWFDRVRFICVRIPRVLPRYKFAVSWYGIVVCTWPTAGRDVCCWRRWTRGSRAKFASWKWVATSGCSVSSRNKASRSSLSTQNTLILRWRSTGNGPWRVQRSS